MPAKGERSNNWSHLSLKEKILHRKLVKKAWNEANSQRTKPKPNPLKPDTFKASNGVTLAGRSYHD